MFSFTITDGDAVQLIEDLTTRDGARVINRDNTGTFREWVSPTDFTVVVDGAGPCTFTIPEGKSLPDYLRLYSEAARSAYSLDDQLTACRSRNETLVQDLATARQYHEEDIERISDRFNQEATTRGWCSEYQDVLNDLNRNLHISLAEPEQDYQVMLSYTVQVYVNVTASDSDSACEQAEAPDSEDVRRVLERNLGIQSAYVTHDDTTAELSE